MQTTASRFRDAQTSDGLTLALRPLDGSTPFLAAWRNLAARSLVGNLFYEPDYVCAGVPAFGMDILLLVVADRPPEAAGARLLALWPCRIVRRWGVPIPALMGLTHGFSIYGAPLIDRDAAQRALDALLDAPCALNLPPRLLIPYLPLDGPFADLLAERLARTGGRRADFRSHRRGFLDLSRRDAAARRNYLAGQLSPKKARQLARLGRRLEREGPVGFETFRQGAELSAAIEDYIALEKAGWKGRAGTAIGLRPAEAAFLRRLGAAYSPLAAIRVDRLRRDGRTLAASIGFTTGGTFWYLKISYAEAEARNSPGVQLVARVTQTLLDDPSLVAADSCAPPDFPVIDTIWAERIGLSNGLIETGGGDALFPLVAWLERLRTSATGRPRALLAGLRNRMVRGRG